MGNIKGIRYTEEQKNEILEYAKDKGVSEAVKEYGVTRNSIYAWRKSLNGITSNGHSISEVKVDTGRVEFTMEELDDLLYAYRCIVKSSYRGSGIDKDKLGRGLILYMENF